MEVLKSSLIKNKVIFFGCIICILVLYTNPGKINIDNLLLIDSSIRLWFGQSPECLSWPSSLQLIFYSITALVDFIFTTDSIFSSNLFDAIQNYYIDYYQNPSHLMNVVHIVNLLALIIILYKILEDKSIYIIWLITLLFFSTISIYYELSRYVGDTMGMLLAWLFFDKVKKDSDIRSLSLISALAVGSRFFYAFLILYFFLKSNKPHKQKFIYLLYTFILVITFNPFLVTDTFLIIKGFAGNILVKQGGEITYYQILDNINTIISNFGPLILCFLISLIFSYKMIKFFKVEIIFFLILILPFIFSNNLYPRYFFPAFSIVLYLITEFYSNFINKKIILWFSIAFSAILFSWNIISNYSIYTNDYHSVNKFIAQNKNITIWIPIQMERYIKLNSSYYNEKINELKQNIGNSSIISVVENKTHTQLPTIFKQMLEEDKMLKIFNYTILKDISDSININSSIFFYTSLNRDILLKENYIISKSVLPYKLIDSDNLILSSYKIYKIE